MTMHHRGAHCHAEVKRLLFYIMRKESDARMPYEMRRSQLAYNQSA